MIFYRNLDILNIILWDSGSYLNFLFCQSFLTSFWRGNGVIGLLPPGRDGSSGFPFSLHWYLGEENGTSGDCWVGAGVQGPAAATLAGKGKGASLLLLTCPPMTPCGSGFTTTGQWSNPDSPPGLLWHFPRGERKGTSLPPGEAKSPGSPRYHPNGDAAPCSSLARMKA